MSKHKVKMSLEQNYSNIFKYAVISIFLTLVSSRKLPTATTTTTDGDVIQINLGFKKYHREDVPAFSTIIIKCSYDKPIWFKNDQRIQDVKYGNLIIYNRIKVTDSGYYSCRSDEGNWSNVTLSVNPDEGSKFKSKNDKIEQIDNLMDQETRPPYFTKKENLYKSMDKFKGDSVRLKCLSDGQPKPNITWTKNGRTLIENGEFVTITGWTLQLENLNNTDSGRYTCNVCNIYGCVNFTTNLEVKAKTSTTPMQKSNTFGDNIQIYSQLSEDLEIDDGDDYFERNELNNTSNEKHNTEHDEKETTNEDPIIEENEKEMAPRFTKPDSLIRLIAKPSGNMAKFKCAAEGNPTPNITWTKDGSPISRSMGQVTYRKWGIILEDLVPKDSGQYTCTLCNIHGCINFTAKLDVKDRVNHKPIITKAPQNQTLNVGASVVLQCTVLSDLHLHIQWLFGGCEDCTDENTILKTDPDNPEELKLENITYEDEGWYTCVAANSLGLSAAKAYLHVVDVLPEDPILAPINSNPVVTIAIVVISITFIIVTLGIMYVQFRKIKHEKLMKHRAMETVHQWTKKIIIVKPAADTSNPEHMQIPIVKIEKQRTTLVQSPSNDLNPFNEYEFPLDSNWEFSRCQLALGPTLGEGAFGRVVMAEAHGLIKNATSLIVAVKMVKEGHTDSDMASLVQEMEVMKMIGKHINIINLLGCCSQDGPLYVIVEYAPHGNLKEFLKKHRPTSEYEVGMTTTDEVERKHVSQKDLISFAFQIARGMEYLASRRCIHRDLAARNVLVSDDYVVKIADFGLARDIQESEYYRKNTNGRLPIKWMAPESLRDKFYDTQSDVWSYGVLLWEIMTYGEQPYPQIYSSEHLYEFLREGNRMEKPSRCSLNIYMLMRQCWNWNPTERPNFTEIVENLDKILSATANKEYLDVDVPLLQTPPSSDDDDSDTETLQEHSLLRYPY